MTIDIVESFGDDELARVFVARTRDGSHIEFVESVQPPKPRTQKWVLIVSTLKGCPVHCPICDAGGHYEGKLTADEIVAQIDHLVLRRFPDGVVPTPMTKVQFARMGDPAFNMAVLDAIEMVVNRGTIKGFFPSISTVAPFGCGPFLDRMIQIKNQYFSGGRFQMQFSLHTTDFERRRALVPIKTLSLADMGRFGESFFVPGDRKITLNFAAVEDSPIDPLVLKKHFSPEQFMVKLTPVNPTFASDKFNKKSLVDPAYPERYESLVAALRAAGFDVIVSIGELRENQIGSNCGMYVTKLDKRDRTGGGK